MKLSCRLAAALVAAAISGCAVTPVSEPSPIATARPAQAADAHASAVHRAAGAPLASVEGPTPAVDLSPQILFQILAADLALQRGEVGAAWNTYSLLARQTRDPRLARRATEIALGGRALTEATQSARLWQELSPESTQASQTLETLLLASGKLSDVEPMLAARLARARQAGTLAEAYPALQRNLLRSPDRPAAWQMLQRLSAADLNEPQARLARLALASAAREEAAALSEARAAIALAPSSEPVIIAAARQIALSPDGLPDAQRLLAEFLEKNPESVDGRDLYARVLLADGQADKAREQFEQALARAPGNSSLLLAIAQLSQQDRRFADARRYFERYLATPSLPRRDRHLALIQMAQVAADEGRPDEAFKWLDQVAEGDEYLLAVTKRAQLTAKSGQLEAARKMLQQAPATGINDKVLLLTAESQLLRDARRNQESFDLLTRALQDYPDQTDLLYDHAMAAERLDRIDDMEKSMRRLIELRPDHAHAYNALGYSLADRSLRLAEARSLIEKALALLPDDAHIMDSMGWVMFRQNDMAGALKFLRKAYAVRREADIGAHLGEVLWSTGQRDEARAIWREVKAREPDNTTLQETLSRLNVAL